MLHFRRRHHVIEMMRRDALECDGWDDSRFYALCVSRKENRKCESENSNIQFVLSLELGSVVVLPLFGPFSVFQELVSETALF